MDKKCEINVSNYDAEEHELDFTPINHETQDNNSNHEIHRKFEAESVTWKDVRFQIWASNVGYLFFINDGISLAFSNLILDEFDASTGSWFASMVSLFIPIGSLMSGPVMDRFGRKKANAIIALPCIPGWFMTCFASLENVFVLYSARVLLGVASGLAASNIVYVSEISNKKFRPAFLSLVSFYFAFGILLVSILQIFMTWRQVAFFNGIFFTMALILTVLFTPESPIWLANFRADWNGAKRSLHWLNPNPKIFEEEWRELCNSMKHVTDRNKKNSIILSNPAVYKPMCILFILFTFQEASFIYALIMYAIQMFPLISPQLGEAIKNEAFALLGVARFLANVGYCLLSLKVGRRPLLIISSLGMTVTSLILAVLLLIFSNTEHTENRPFFEIYEWSMVIVLVLFVVFGTFGVMSIPWSLMAELLPHEARSGGSAIIMGYSYLLFFFLAKIFPDVLQNFDVCYLFVFITTVSAIMCAFIFFFIPETWGRSFLEIEEYFSKGVWIVR